MSTTTDNLKQFTIGTYWKIKDLTSETGKKFNGKKCVIVSIFDASTGRLGVRITNTVLGRILNIKPFNLHDDQSTAQTEGQEEGLKETPIQEEEDKEDCPICTDALPKLSSEFARLTCCGKGLHIKCYEDLVATKCMTWEQKDTCIMCRSKMPAAGSKEQIERIRGWVKKGKAWAMAVLGDRYTDGVGVKQSDKKAVELYEMAAKRGNAGAQFSLGEFYEHGSHGLTQSSQRAIELYTLSAEQGAAEAQFKIGSCYFQGNIVEQSFVKAREWMTKAAAQGHYGAIQCLKMMDAMGM